MSKIASLHGKARLVQLVVAQWAKCCSRSTAAFLT